VGQSTCTVPATVANFGDPCKYTSGKKLAAAVTCTGVEVTTVVASAPVDESADLPVDCGATGVPGKDCWGFSDGILSPLTGLLRNDDGIMVAKYMARCALPTSDSVNVVDYTGRVQHLKGELALAPTWADGECNAACQENISACLMALTNASGQHIPLVLSSTKNALGGGTDSKFPNQEGAFFGNLFESPVQAYFCKGSGQQNIATMWYSYASDMFNARMCENGSSAGSNECPYVGAGDCTGMAWSPQACSKASDGTMTSCKGGGKTWQYPITTYLAKK